MFTRRHYGTGFSLYSPEVTSDTLITYPNIKYIDDNIKAVESGSILSLCLLLCQITCGLPPPPPIHTQRDQTEVNLYKLQP